MKNMSFSTKRIIAAALVVSIVCLLVAAFSWFYSHSTIEILMPANATNASALIESGTSTKVIKLKKEKTSTIVTRGDYSVSVSADQGSYITVLATGRFLKKSAVQATLTEEVSREFIGDNPKPCIRTIPSGTLSYDCTGFLQNLGFHVPATATTPTYVKSMGGGFLSAENEINLGSIEGSAYIAGRLYVLAHQPEIEGVSDSSHILYEIITEANQPTTVFVKALDQLSPNKDYVMSQSSEGNITISSDNYGGIYSTTTFDKLEDISVKDAPDPNKFKLLAVAKNKDVTVVAYEEATSDIKKLDSKDYDTKIYTINEQNSDSRLVDRAFSVIDVCGDKICALDFKETLTFYSYSMEKLYELHGVKDFKFNNDTLYYATNNGVFSFNDVTKSGFMSYRLGDYRFEHLNATSQGIVVTVNSGSRTHALLLDNSSSLKYALDKSVLALSKESYINTVSVYKNNIFISPELGSLIEVSDSPALDYNPDTKKKVSQQIQAKLNELGVLNRSFEIKVNNL